MPLDFCTRTAGKLRRMGLPKKTARRFAGFFYTSMVSVCASLLSSTYKKRAGLEKMSQDIFDMMGAAPCPEGRGGTGEEIRRSPRRPVLLPSVLLYPDASPGIDVPGPRAVYVAPGYSRLRRR